MGFIHRDIKPENILVSKDHDGYLKVKLCDLGLTVRLPEDINQDLTEVLGTPTYVAPEVLRH